MKRQPVRQRRKRQNVRIAIYVAIMLIIVLGAVGIFIIALNNYNQQEETQLTATAIALIPTATNTPTSTLSPTATLSPTSTFTATSTVTPTATTTTIPSDTPTPTITPSVTRTPTPTPDAVVTRRNGVILRTGPGTFYFVISTLPVGTFLKVISRTENKTWIKVKLRNASGWVIAENLHIYVNLDAVLPASREELLKIPTTHPCVDVTGDSVAHGGAIFELPNVGYARAPMAPVSHFIDLALQANGLDELTAIDRSVSAVALSSPIHDSYLNTSAYKELLKDRCKFTVIMPWINDLSSGVDSYTAAANHIDALANLVRELTQRNPFGRIILLDYYAGAPTPFSLNSFATGYVPANVSAFNQAIAQACSTSIFSRYKQVSCLVSDTIFATMGTSYVAGAMTRAQVEADLISGINEQETNWINQYLAANPNGLLIGDGVHLSTGGKAVLGTYLVTYMMSLPALTPDF